MIKTTAATLAGLIAVAVIVVGATARSRVERPAGEGSAPPWAIAERREMTPRVLATGDIRLLSGARINVGARVSGVVVSLPVRQGSRVARNDVIARLDDREARTRLDIATAAVTELQVTVDQQTDLLAREAQLASDGGVSQEELLAARTSLATSRARLAGAAFNRTLATLQLEYTVIRAPIGGFVGSVTTHEGETVSASLSSPTFVTLLDPSRIECVALVDESDIGRVRVADGVEFTVDAYPARVFHGRVVAMAPDATVISGVVDYEVRASVLDADELLKPQMTASVSIAGATRTTLMVPAAAIRQSASGPFVWRRRGSTPAAVPVLLGARQTDVMEVRSGLAAGDTVLTASFPER